MLEKIIAFFAKRHILTNFIVLLVFLAGFVAWQKIGKEELPDFTLGFLRITTVYPGAAPEDVERLVTRPLEEEIKGYDGIYSVNSTSSVGVSNITIEFMPGYEDQAQTVLEIRNAVLGVKLPAEVKDLPSIREFKTAKKSIIHIGVYDQEKVMLDEKARRKVQGFARFLEDQLTGMGVISEISRTGYLAPELQIHLLPDKMARYNISISEVLSQLKMHHIRQPAGSLENLDETKITVLGELDDIKKLQKLVIRSNFEGPVIRLGQIASIKDGFERNTSIVKVNGYEAVLLQVYKSLSTDILSAQKEVMKKVSEFRQGSLKNSSVKVHLLDDESQSVRSRLSLIGVNGLIGFILILLMLFVFLDFKSGLWVAMGIPFTFCFSLVGLILLGYTLNNITLAAVIIVMGMIVDDAIVVAENVARVSGTGVGEDEASIRGTREVTLPIVASILTTCAAFVPLFFFEGRFGQIIYFIPPVIFLMLLGSLFESIFILPAHLRIRIPRWVMLTFTLGFYALLEKRQKQRFLAAHSGLETRHWFHVVEDFYGKILKKILSRRWLIFTVFALLLAFSLLLFKSRMKFVMFPDEETTELFLSAETKPGTSRYETARLALPIEAIIAKDLGTEVVGFRTTIAQSRRGGVVEQNRLTIRIELFEREKRQYPSAYHVAKWNKEFKNIPGFTRIIFGRSRFGQSSGSSIELVIQENDDKIREAISDELTAAMKEIKDLQEVEADKPIQNSEYKMYLRRELLTQLDISPTTIPTALRTVLEGSILYDFIRDDEEVEVRVTVDNTQKDKINKVLEWPVKNSRDYLVPIKNILSIEKVNSPNAIKRKNHKRTVSVFADLKENAKMTPLEIAEHFEQKIFPGIVSRYPSAILSFGGEIKDTRESKGDIYIAVILALFLIFGILALQFDSLTKPLIIMLAIPFGGVGVILTFWAHGISLFGFFSAIGALGLSGVVVNDSIVLLDKLENEYHKTSAHAHFSERIADIAKTRLKAVFLTTFTTVAGVMPTAYGIAGYDSMLAEMMLVLSWGLLFATFITLVLTPALYSVLVSLRLKKEARRALKDNTHAL